MDSVNSVNITDYSGGKRWPESVIAKILDEDGLTDKKYYILV